MITISPLNSDAYYFLPGFILSKDQQRFDVAAIRKNFPILNKSISGKPLIWLDNAATTQKPKQMIDGITEFYNTYNSNIHRGAHTLAKLATNAYEASRETVCHFIGASTTEEVIFVRGTTEAINLVAESFGEMVINNGDEILLTTMEHHSNIVPWQKLKHKGAVIKVIPINDRGEIILEEYQKLLSDRTKIVSIAHVSNILGTINPIETMIKMAHRQGAYVLVDGAQAVSHIGVNVQKLDADFYVFSGHKIYGPTGIGVLYGKKALLEKMPVWQRGGGMIQNVDWEESSYNHLPYKFEAGTGNIADAIGLGVSLEYIKEIGLEKIERYERALTNHAMKALHQIPGVQLIGTAADKTSVLSFLINGISADDTARDLDEKGIAVRAGHHCAQPTLNRFGLKNCVRASLGMYNTREEVDYLIQSIKQLMKHHIRGEQL